ncbi:MAG TPA: hypothetical protein VEF04_20795, partial [Blastocatellia bacterium]|nr:hypothetical protein [Blastocatellia bacterium]
AMNNSALIISSSSAQDQYFSGYVKSLDGEDWPWATMPTGVLEGEYVSNLETDERDMINTLGQLTLGLLLAFEARPEYYTPGSRQKAARHSKREIWTPNILGSGYRIKGASEQKGGTHASPRLHWRRGHYRIQRFGAGLTETKRIWIEPVLVGAGEGGQDAA